MPWRDPTDDRARNRYCQQHETDAEIDLKPSAQQASAQRLRLARVRQAVVTSLPVMGIVAGMHWFGMLQPAAMLLLEALILAQMAGFAAAVYTGLNLKLRDPSMTAAQVVGASSVLLLGAYFATADGRAIALMMLPLVFAFASYRYGAAGLMRLSGVLLALTAIEQTAAVVLRADPIAVPAAALQTLTFGVGLLTFSAVGGQVNDLRRRTQFERAMAGMALAQLHEAVVAVDLDYKVRFFNPGAARLLGLDIDAVTGRPIDQLFAMVQQGKPSELLRASNAAADGAPDTSRTHVATLVLQSGARREVELTTGVLARASGEMVGYVLVARDVEQTNRLIRDLTHYATHDTLTGLKNRRGFLADLHAVCAAGTVPPSTRARIDCVLMLDLDQFKIVNDSCGHRAGDELLRNVAEIIRSHFSQARSVARMGGDEFAAIVTVSDLDEGERLADALMQTLAAYRFVRDGRAFRVGASIGMAAINVGNGDEETWLARADAACYLAKELGRGRVQVYRDGDDEIARHRSDLGWVSRLQDAIERDRFVLFAQRIVPANASDSSAPADFELLLRLRSDDGSLIPPNAFLPAAERFGLMSAIDRWVIARAVTELRTHVSTGESVSRLSINLSASSLRDRMLLPFIAQQLASSGLDGGRFTFELTESAALVDLQQAREFIVGLKQLGCRVSLDDVGTGFSSFAHLRALPIDQIKIDGSFVRAVCDNPLDRVLVESLQRVADVLGVETVAEFVENESISRALRGIGIGFLQGFGVHRPEPIAGILAAQPVATSMPA